VEPKLWHRVLFKLLSNLNIFDWLDNKYWDQR
jgi:hypothetical protein